MANSRESDGGREFLGINVEWVWSLVGVRSGVAAGSEQGSSKSQLAPCLLAGMGGSR